MTSVSASHLQLFLLHNFYLTSFVNRAFAIRTYQAQVKEFQFRGEWKENNRKEIWRQLNICFFFWLDDTSSKCHRFRCHIVKLSAGQLIVFAVIIWPRSLPEVSCQRLWGWVLAMKLNWTQHCIFQQGLAQLTSRWWSLSLEMWRIFDKTINEVVCWWHKW